MTDLETRVRTALHGGTAWRSADEVLDAVRRGARRRRRRRTAVVAAAAALVLAATGGTVLHLRTRNETAARPAGFTTGPVAVSVTATGQVFEVVANQGCSGPCSVVRAEKPGSQWVRLATFRATDSRLSRDVGAVWRIAMASNGRDGWVWGYHLYSTHDGGKSWRRVLTFPGDGPGDSTAGDFTELVVGGGEAWAHTDAGHERVLLHTPVGSDRWTRVRLPTEDSFFVVDALPDSRVVVDVERDSWSAREQHLLVGDEAGWHQVVLPYRDVPPLFHRTLFTRSTGIPSLAGPMGRLGPFGYDNHFRVSLIPVGMAPRSPTMPVGPVKELYVRGNQAAVVTPSGVHPVRLRLGSDDRIADYSLLGDRVVFITSGGRLFVSDDGGHTWAQQK